MPLSGQQLQGQTVRQRRWSECAGLSCPLALFLPVNPLNSRSPPAGLIDGYHYGIKGGPSLAYRKPVGHSLEKALDYQFGVIADDRVFGAGHADISNVGGARGHRLRY